MPHCRRKPLHHALGFVKQVHAAWGMPGLYNHFEMKLNSTVMHCGRYANADMASNLGAVPNPSLATVKSILLLIDGTQAVVGVVMAHATPTWRQELFCKSPQRLKELVPLLEAQKLLHLNLPNKVNGSKHFRWRNLCAW
jgi:hypothetical protein